MTIEEDETVAAAAAQCECRAKQHAAIAANDKDEGFRVQLLAHAVGKRL